jgi:hypothetical protein
MRLNLLKHGLIPWGDRLPRTGPSWSALALLSAAAWGTPAPAQWAVPAPVAQTVSPHSPGASGTGRASGVSGGVTSGGSTAAVSPSAASAQPSSLTLAPGHRVVFRDPRTGRVVVGDVLALAPPSQPAPAGIQGSSPVRGASPMQGGAWAAGTGVGGYGSGPYAVQAPRGIAQPAPVLGRLPVLAEQRLLPWPEGSLNASARRTAYALGGPLGPYRPAPAYSGVPPVGYPGYSSASTQVAAAPPGWRSEPGQSAMQPTIVR